MPILSRYRTKQKPNHNLFVNFPYYQLEIIVFYNKEILFFSSKSGVDNNNNIN